MILVLWMLAESLQAGKTNLGVCKYLYFGPLLSINKANNKEYCSQLYQLARFHFTFVL